MNINPVNSSTNVDSITGVAPNANRTPSSIPPAGNAGPANAQISRPGQLLGRLQQLSESDPAAFKQVTEDIADKLRQSAQGLSGAAADRANALADRFAAASQSGNVSSLEPQQAQGAQGAQGHHHHHHGGGGGGAAGGIASVLSNALDEVNQALASASGTSSTSSDSSGSNVTASA
jgi:hypothetical protein